MVMVMCMCLNSCVVYETTPPTRMYYHYKPIVVPSYHQHNHRHYHYNYRKHYHKNMTTNYRKYNVKHYAK